MRVDQSATSKSLSQLIFSIYAKNGIAGFYPNYRATLAKNIPSAIIRFTAYEEFKYILSTVSPMSESTMGTVVTHIAIE
jgi:hypothetical protein